MRVLRRIVNSRKSAIAFVTLVGNAAALFGFNVPSEALTEGIGLVWNSLGGLLIAGQSVIDAFNGAPSDAE